MAKIIGKISHALPVRKYVPIYKTGYYTTKQLVNDYGSGYGNEYIISIDNYDNDHAEAQKAIGVYGREYGDVWNQTRVYEASITPREARKFGWKEFKYIAGWS